MNSETQKPPAARAFQACVFLSMAAIIALQVMLHLDIAGLRQSVSAQSDVILRVISQISATQGLQPKQP